MTSDAEHTRILAEQDIVLIDLSGGGRLTDRGRRALYSLPPWRAAMLARVAHRAAALSRGERDGIVREASAVGGNGTLKPWSDRTPAEQQYGVRAGNTTGLRQG